MKNNILHIMVLEKFIPPFMNFIDMNFDSSNHVYMILGRQRMDYGLTNEHQIVWIDGLLNLPKLFSALYKAKKVIIHGLWSEPLLKILFIQPWLLKKSYHVMWGGDFYFPEEQSWIKKQVIKKIGHFITYIKGDYLLAQKLYGAKGEYHECFMYPSNLYHEYDIKPKEYSIINIQLGNSADSTNNHIDMLEKLRKYKDENINIYVPLSYGEKEYAIDVITKGKEIFGEKFIPLTEFVPFDNYLELLGDIDIAIFAHKRQQAMGNTITLLGLGKKVYMRNDIVTWQFLKTIDIEVFDVENIEIDILDNNIKGNNKQKIKDYFSKENLIVQLKSIFGENSER
ncbi:MAG: TDP-N-acetylfucosamine:lipid II N-acetylfucosaminyltransferase [Sulfuricurvum sp.]|jgi:hypothetical protein